MQEAHAKGKRARQDMVAKYSPEVIGGVLIDHISRIVRNQREMAEAADDNDSRDEL